jgi:hypothetical protein
MMDFDQALIPAYSGFALGANSFPAHSKLCEDFGHASLNRFTQLIATSWFIRSFTCKKGSRPKPPLSKATYGRNARGQGFLGKVTCFTCAELNAAFASITVTIVHINPTGDCQNEGL